MRFDNIQHFIPLRLRHIDAGRILTAWVQNQDAVFRQCFEKRSHFFKFHADGFRVVIRIRPHFKTGAFKNTFMVVPSRVADIGFCIREPTVQKVGTDFQRPRAAQGLYGRNAPFCQRRIILAKQQMLNRASVSVQTFHRQIRRWSRYGRTLCFCPTDRFQNRHFAFVIKINADAQIDFFRTLVAFEGFNQTQNRIARIILDMTVHGASFVFRQNGEDCGTKRLYLQNQAV